MGSQNLKTFLAITMLMINSLLLFSQIEGESVVTSIKLKKPTAYQSESEAMAIRMIDTLPPILKIISPLVDSTRTFQTGATTSYLIGRLTDASGIRTLTINDSLVPVDENGFFQPEYPLKEGLNVFRISASDNASNNITEFLQIIKVADHQLPKSAGKEDYPGEYYGLIIAINKYEDPALSNLDHPITDATFLYSTLLGNYNFKPENLKILKDATRADIIRALDKLNNQLSVNDNLLLFYAGHGYWDEKKETGYWLPSDAEQSSSVNWIRNSTIQDYIDDIQTRHTLLITDACFAGSIFKTRGAFQDASIAINKLYSLSSRKAMTSGTLQEVPDKSVFIEYFMKNLQENDQKYISGSELFNSIRLAVMNNSPNIPQYGVIQDTGDEGGEFIFIKR